VMFAARVAGMWPSRLPPSRDANLRSITAAAAPFDPRLVVRTHLWPQRAKTFKPRTRARRGAAAPPPAAGPSAGSREWSCRPHFRAAMRPRTFTNPGRTKAYSGRSPYRIRSPWATGPRPISCASSLALVPPVSSFDSYDEAAAPRARARQMFADLMADTDAMMPHAVGARTAPKGPLARRPGGSHVHRLWTVCSSAPHQQWPGGSSTPAGLPLGVQIVGRFARPTATAALAGLGFFRLRPAGRSR